jgi:hypothetical protein
MQIVKRPSFAARHLLARRGRMLLLLANGVTIPTLPPRLA